MVAIELSVIDRHTPIVKTLAWASEDATRTFAIALAAQGALRNAFVALRGELGAGKTTLVRHLLQALGVAGRIKSPTYAVVEPYSVNDLNIWHFDFYRFADPQEWEDAGFRDIFASVGLKLAEWPDHAGSRLPTADLEIALTTVTETARSATLTARTPLGVQLLDALQPPKALA